MRRQDLFREMMRDARLPELSRTIGAHIYLAGPGEHRFTHEDFQRISFGGASADTIRRALRPLKLHKYIRSEQKGQQSPTYTFGPFEDASAEPGPAPMPVQAAGPAPLPVQPSAGRAPLPAQTSGPAPLPVQDSRTRTPAGPESPASPPEPPSPPSPGMEVPDLSQPLVETSAREPVVPGNSQPSHARARQDSLPIDEPPPIEQVLAACIRAGMRSAAAEAERPILAALLLEHGPEPLLAAIPGLPRHRMAQANGAWSTRLLRIPGVLAECVALTPAPAPPARTGADAYALELQRQQSSYRERHSLPPIRAGPGVHQPVSLTITKGAT
jgi:hypothetical protein